MNTLVAVSIVPLGEGESVSDHVAKVIKVLNDSSMPTKTTSMFTEIEGPWDEVMAVVKKAVEVLTEQGIRTEVFIKGDIRPGHENMMESKVTSVNEHLD
ncbi:MAG: MTH1187 family thiamine-binding protein [Alkalibacterium sp.]|nr:MTH1187 family thiamine-binding protein [Alkalibacterium sp.]